MEQHKAAAEAAALLATDPAVVRLVDCETDRLKDARAVEVHVADGAGTTLFSRRFNPGRPQDPGAIAVHHITDAALGGCPDFSEHIATLNYQMHSGSRLLAYNVPFDHGVLVNEWTRALPGQPLPRWLDDRSRWWCVMRAWSRFNGFWDLEEGRYRHRRLGGTHTAAGDVKALLDRVHTMAAAYTRLPSPRARRVADKVLSAAPEAVVVRIHCNRGAATAVRWAGAYATVFAADFERVSLSSTDAGTLGRLVAAAHPQAAWPRSHDFHVATGQLGLSPDVHARGYIPEDDREFGTVWSSASHE
ncbi:3'-5' exonuclease [Streptomyces sp. NPDC006632]|uniref:3'-5' exonuclease n=1 Tax=Streptomyces sp. NPDC006632 TaxID=3157182 RepID=UPI0033BAAD1C